MSTKSKIQNAMSHMMTSVVGSHSKLHKRSAKTEECDDGGSHSKVQKRNSKAEKTEECEEDEFDPTLLPLPTTSTKTATQRIYKELKIIVHKQDTPSNDLGFYVKLDKLRSVYQWVVQLTDFDPNIPLAQDMARHKVKSIDLEIRFAPDYPNLPPYIRVIRPRLLRFMNGGGGHVTAGGSICMDLLTLGNSHDQGWSSEYTMEAVLIQVKLALSTLNPPARLDRNWKNEYSPVEAMNAYIRVANQHGWGIPPQWDTLFKR
ncbi:ubiquitin-conjugating enzyme/RWD-like protein [Glomus cerebriforme]|uniref:Ubiquitin-conjugating enzyme/RWD-like protein n=1 Tax=Glomus cerebriforme TaxID=658196 RepID=A0A397TPS0_9GLOM|nr:ubiquitin-conjugating enzyme/RWD-like protein [Glomus cerebriforme]